MTSPTTGGPPKEVIKQVEVSIVLLTYNRREPLIQNLDKLLASLAPLSAKLEFIVVDNASTDGIAEVLEANYPDIFLVRNEKNLGAVGRNTGIAAAQGKIILTLDDDVGDITPSDIKNICDQFDKDKELGALCFKVVRHTNGQLCNWCHHKDPEQYADQCFFTYEISEGAVAFRSAALSASGLYSQELFISHEGFELAIRLLNAGYSIKYDGNIVVTHSHEESGRSSWRRYYYDTRNLLVIAHRHMNIAYASRYLFLGLGGMFVYSVRDGYIRQYFRGLYDGLKMAAAAREERAVWSGKTAEYFRAIDCGRPSFRYYVRNRLLRKTVEI